MTASMTAATAGFALPSLSSNHKLHRVLSSALGQKPSADSIEACTPWEANFFGLEACSLFTDATEEEQREILQIANCDLLCESYAIEKAGVGYMAKMTLLAETTQERMLYSLFGADEATHLSQLMPFVIQSAADENCIGKNDPFLKLLETLLEQADRTALIFVIQVVLEGWGLSHYRLLSKHCRHQGLSDLFRGFLQAESRHHGVGVILFEEVTLSSQSREVIVETLAAFLQMVQVGPQRLVAAIAQVKGGLSRAQRIQLLRALETERHSEGRLSLLRSLIVPVSPDIAETLDSHGLFSPLAPSRCV
ncbi:MAG: ferritin-like domain-containing protein [Cyanobacteria bacterium J06649_4]